MNDKPVYDVDKLTHEEVKKKLLGGQLLKRTARLLKLEQIQQAIKKEYPTLDIKQADPMTLMFLIISIILYMGEGPEIARLRVKHEQALKMPRVDFDTASYKEINEYLLNSFGLMNRINLQIFDLALGLDKVNRLIINMNKTTWVMPGKEDPTPAFNYLSILNNQLYFNFREKIAKGDFQIEEGKWPEADISGGGVVGKTVIMPDPDSISPVIKDETLAELRAAMEEKVLDLAKHGDLAADVFDIITAKWLKEAKHYEAMIDITADDFLQARGLKAQRSGSGRRGGYKDEWRQMIQQQINNLSYQWITVKEMEIIQMVKGKRKKVKWRDESKALTMERRMGQVKLDGSLDAYAWRLRPGAVFNHYLFGPGRQTALLSQKALQYDPYRQTWEKRLTRYLAWIWRIDTGRTREGLLVKTLLAKAGEEINKRYPGRTRDRLHKALDQLKEDGVITTWKEYTDEGLTARRGWWRQWLESKITLTAPPEILEHYKQIEKPKRG